LRIWGFGDLGMFFIYIYLIYLFEITFSSNNRHKLPVKQTSMKKIILLALLIVCISGIRANIAAPQAFISEILVDSTGNWTIEMGFYDWPEDIDSIWLVTSSGGSLVTYYTVISAETGCFDSLSVITSSNLANPVSINPEGDFVKLISYAWGDDLYDIVSFGDYPGSYLDCIRNGESVIWSLQMAFCIDSSPTIGLGNDSEGYRGYFSGIIYDLSGNPITTGFVSIVCNANLTFFPDDQGNFNEYIASRRFTFDTVQHHMPPWPWTVQTYTIEPVDFCLRPDSTYSQDIITTSLVIGIDDKEVIDENIVTIAPNPFSDKVDFYFNIKNQDREFIFSIYSLDGKKILKLNMDEDQKKLQWHPSDEIPPGTYIYRLENENKSLKTGKFVRL
jgi:hypothetical protein